MKKILSAKINRKTFLFGWLILAILLACLRGFTMLINQHMNQYEILLFIGYILIFLSYVLLFNARGNDIGLTPGENIGAIATSLIPIIGLFLFLYFLFKRGEDYNQYLPSKEINCPQSDNINSNQTKNVSMIKSRLFSDMKKLWGLIFCTISLAICILYVPYNLIPPSNPAITLKTAHSTIFDLPKDFNPRFTKIDYEAIAFREILILLGCCAGYTLSTIIKKK